MLSDDRSSARPLPLAISPWDRDADGVRITAVRSYATAPAGAPLLVVRVETSVDGLVGWGCASSPQRPRAIRTVIDEYLGPLATGRLVADIDDVHHLASLSPYWRGGAIENNALAGLDLALWDIKGKLASMPVHQLVGGRVRDRVDVYGHADGRDPAEVVEGARRFLDAGYRFIRCQVAVPDADTYGIHQAFNPEVLRRVERRTMPWHPREYARAVPRLFDAVRDALGDHVELLHDVHERLPPMEAIRLARDLESHRLLFLEDALAPEDLEWYRELRAASTTKQAVGEVFTDVRTFVPLIVDRLIDFARVRMGAVGGLTTTLKLAHLCEFFGTRLALHGPGDISPIGHAAAIHVDASSRAFGIQEAVVYDDRILSVFPGAPDIHDGAYRVSTAPGIGVGFDEREAAKYPPPEPLDYDRWALLRREDGSVVRP